MGRPSRESPLNRQPVAWVFNLDAEDDLSRPGPHTPSKQMRERIEGLLPALSRLLGPDDEVLWPASERPLRAKWGRAWCPTKWANSQMERVGLSIPPAPSSDVLRDVNHRKFAHDLGQALPGAQFVQTFDSLISVLSNASLLSTISTERNWLMKRALGYAGRGRRKIAPRVMREVDRTWIEAALRSGGLQVEPMVVRELDTGLHGWIRADGTVFLGEPTLHEIDDSGMWISTARAGDGVLTSSERDALVKTANDTAQALIARGYFGPFCIDAFRWRAPDGSIHFQPRCELNARYTMGWAVGMGDFTVPAGSW